MAFMRTTFQIRIALSLAIFASTPAMPVAATSHSVEVSHFASGDLSGWQEKVFHKKTRYELVNNDGADGVGTVLMAHSNASASGLVREMNIDLTKTPCLAWSWKVDGVLDGLDETTKAGDDYAARVYVVFSGGAFFWNTRALSYVWSSQQPVGATWPNAYSSNAIVLAAQSGSRHVGQWVSQRHNIRDDFKRLFGEDITQADAVAIMTDTDNSGRSATAYYGEITLSPAC